MKKSILFLALSAVAMSGCEKSKEQVEHKPLYTAAIGLAPYTFRRSWPNNLVATLDTVSSMGFTEIEGGGGNMDAAEYKKLCDERGLSIPSMGAGYDALLNDIQAVIDRAKIYGAKYIMVAWIPHDGGNFNFENARKAVADFNQIGEILAQNGLKLAYHAHGYEFVQHGEGTLLDYIIQNTNPDNVCFEMDIFWIYFGGGDPAGLLRKYGDRWKLMHLKDMKKGHPRGHTGLTDEESNVALGQGELDIPGILRTAKEVGIEHYFIEDESSRIITQIPQSIEYLRSLEE